MTLRSILSEDDVISEYKFYSRTRSNGEKLIAKFIELFDANPWMCFFRSTSTDMQIFG